MRYGLKVRVNGEEYEAQVEARCTLVTLLRDHLGLTGTKWGCGTGDCGACTVLLEGKPVNSCTVLALSAEGREVTTIEGVRGRDGDLHPLQRAFIEHGAVQCGYCSPAAILVAKSFLDGNGAPSEAEVRSALAGVLCRCTGYSKIIDAVLAAASAGR
jgi:carbon-monoxide dehydrogenase small subunit